MAKKRKEIVFKVINIFPKDGLTWDELGESLLPVIEATLEDFRLLELEDQRKLEEEKLRREKDCNNDELKVE